MAGTNEAMQKQFEAMMESLRGVRFERMWKIGFTPRYGWSDEVCSELARKKLFPEECLKTASQRAILLRFIKFYATGKVPSGFKVFDVIAAPIAIIPCVDAKHAASVIWDREMYGKEDTLFALLPSTAIGENSTEFDRTTDPLSLARLSDARSKFSETYSRFASNDASTDIERFREAIEGTLIASSATEAQDASMIRVRKLLGFLALTLVRGITKSESQLISSFVQPEYRETLNSTVGLSQVRFAPPAKRTVTEAIGAMDKKSLGACNLFAKIATLWAIVKKEKRSEEAAMLDSAVLSHTMYNGMQLISMIEKLCERCSTDWEELRDLTSFTCTEQAWEGVSDFMLEYRNEAKPRYTQPWARVVDDGYFPELAAKDNFDLAVILAAAVERAEGNSRIWNSAWAKQTKVGSGLTRLRAQSMENRKEIGFVLYEKLQKRRVDTILQDFF